jgi:tryptophan-rich sensory protein
MTEMAARRRSWGKIALVTVPAIVLLGSASGWLSGSGYGNEWFAGLVKPVFMPPGFLFGIVWPTLYALLGIALAMVLAEPPSLERRSALIFFFAQLALNFAWSPLFFAAHDIALAKYVIMVMAVLAGVAAGKFWRLRRVAGMLLIPYLAWLVFAAMLNSAIHELNPGAGTALLG